MVGAGLHRNWTLSFSDPVPEGGLTVNLSSSGPTIASVPSALPILAGTTSVSFPVSGLAVGVVQITVTASGWTGDVEEVSVVTPTFYFPYGVEISRTTSSPPHLLSVLTNTPGCGPCDTANADITVDFAVNSTTAGIVIITPTSVTLHLNEYLSDSASVGTPTTTGTYTITASATGFTSVTSPTVTVAP
jgi:hypothetical protein